MSTKFSHVKGSEVEVKGGGLRNFFLYKDLGVADATNGRVLAHITKANLPPEGSGGTGWHIHVAEFQIVYMLKGWAKFMYERQNPSSRSRRLRTATSRHCTLLVRLQPRYGIFGNHYSS